MLGCSGGAFVGLAELEREEYAFAPPGKEPDCLVVTVTHR